MDKAEVFRSIDCLRQGDTVAYQQLMDYIHDLDICADTRFLRRIGMRLAKTEHPLADRVARELSVYPDTTFVQQGDIPQKEWEEAMWFGEQVYRVVGHQDRVHDLCAGNGLAGLYWSHRGWADEVQHYDIRPNAHYPGPTAQYHVQDIYHLHLLSPGLVLSVHACGALTDRVIDQATRERNPFAVVPCCHEKHQIPIDGIGYFDLADAVDVIRMYRAQECGYRVVARRLPKSVTEKNRILIGVPRSVS